MFHSKHECVYMQLYKVHVYEKNIGDNTKTKPTKFNKN